MIGGRASVLPTRQSRSSPRRHARLDHSDLTAALYLQGFRETELVMD
jgi:hypothetical protein